MGALSLLLVVSCASGAAPERGVEPLDSGQDNAVSIEQAREEIKALERQIGAETTNYREEFGVESASPRSADEDLQDLVATPDCELVCRAADGVCQSSQRICVISAQFPDESHFRERCTWASAECASARQRCESCR
jgi:hypothetical protein